MTGDGESAHVDITAGTLANTYQWTFNTDGTTVFPDKTVKSSNTLTIQAFSPSGIPTGDVTKITDNQGWDVNNVGTNLPTTGGTGTGLTVDVSDGGSFYSSITINTPGTGYTDGDEITVTRPDVSETFTINVPDITSSWEFSSNGELTFPDGNVQTGAAISISELKALVANCETYGDCLLYTSDAADE